MTAIDDLTRIRHMRDAGKEILEFTLGSSQVSFGSNRMLQLAIVKDLEIIGEAANNVSIECQNKYLDIPWRAMVGMRNRLVHAYFGIDVDVIWQTVRQDLPPLIASLERVLEELETS
jgi:uncharacterized protein with HEPN domain